MNKFKFAFLTCFAVMFLASCDKDDDPVSETCDSTEMTYTDDIKEIFDTTCATSGCHDAAALLTIGALDTYANAVVFAAFGKTLGAINHETGFSAMPKVGDKLDDCSIAKITNWINNGTPQ